MGLYITGLYWISVSFATADYGGYLLGFIAVLILAGFLSFLNALSFLFIKIFCKNFSYIFNAIIIIFLLALFDWIKGNILWGFPWLPISAIWSFSKITITPLAILGVWGYSLLTFCLIVGIYFIKHRFMFSILFCLPFITIILASNLIQQKSNNIEKINLRLIQPNIKQEEKWEINKLKKNLDTLIELSNKKSEKEIDLTIWTETSVSFDVVRKNENNLYMRNNLREINNIILGAVRLELSEKNKNIYNSLFIFKNNFSSMNYHDKLKLVPFGEYIPFRKLLKKSNFSLVGDDFSSGKELKLFKLKNKVKILPLICYEIIFPNISREKNNDYNLIVNITNDAWYGNSSGPYQHLALAKMRAVQEGVFLIRVANTGISAIINNNGKIVKKIHLNKKGIIDQELVLTKKNTVYSKFGDKIFFFLLIMLFVLFIILKTFGGITRKYE